MSFRNEVFGEKDTLEFKEVPQSAKADKARSKLTRLTKDLARNAPNAPLRGIADLPEMGSERKLARSSATDLAAPREKFDFASSPEVQGIIAQTVDEGNQLLNRIGRAQQKSGGFKSTTGRDVLGRTVKQVEGNIAANLAQFANAERGRESADVERRQKLVGVLENLGLTEENRQLGSDQSKLDAIFNRDTTQGELERAQRAELTAILQGIIQQQPGQQATIRAGDQGLLQEFRRVNQAGGESADTAGKFMSLFGGGAASDRRVKENIEPIDNALEKVKSLKGYTFNYEWDKPEDRNGGIMAQDLEKVLPDAVREVEGVKQVDYNAVIGLLVSAIVELVEKG